MASATLELLDEAIAAAKRIPPGESRVALIHRAEILLAILRQAGERTETSSTPQKQTWTLPLGSLPRDLLAAVCFNLTDRDVLYALSSVSRELRVELHRAEFLATRAQSRLSLLPSQLLNGCACLLQRAGAPSALQHYFDRCIDYSRGTELHPLSIRTVINLHYQEKEIRFHSQLPAELVDGTFRYEAGPWPAAVALQVYRAGSPTGHGFGLRTLAPIATGDFVCTYWGEYQTHDYHERPTDYAHPSLVPKPTPYTLFGDGHDLCHADVEANELEIDEEDEDTCPACGQLIRTANSMDVSSWFEFRIDASSVGNAARWINHSRSQANLEARLSRDAASPHAHGWKVSFYATRVISSGEPLLWDYMRSRRVRKGAPATGGLPENFFLAGGTPETLRSIPDGQPVRADWQSCHRSDSEGTYDSLLIQGYPPHAPAPGVADQWADDVGYTWEDSLERYKELFPRRIPRLVDAPWQHDEDAHPPKKRGDPERGPYWSAGNRWWYV